MLLLSLIESDLPIKLIIFIALFCFAVCGLFFISHFSSILIQRREAEIQSIRDDRESLLVRLLFDANSEVFNDEIHAIYEEFKSIGKEKPLSETSRTWIEKELKPYFADSLKKQKADLSEMAFEHIVNEDISSEEAKPFFDAYNKKQGFINRIKK